MGRTAAFSKQVESRRVFEERVEVGDCWAGIWAGKWGWRYPPDGARYRSGYFRFCDWFSRQQSFQRGDQMGVWRVTLLGTGGLCQGDGPTGCLMRALGLGRQSWAQHTRPGSCGVLDGAEDEELCAL